MLTLTSSYLECGNLFRIIVDRPSQNINKASKIWMENPFRSPTLPTHSMIKSSPLLHQEEQARTDDTLNTKWPEFPILNTSFHWILANIPHRRRQGANTPIIDRNRYNGPFIQVNGTHNIIVRSAPWPQDSDPSDPARFLNKPSRINAKCNMWASMSEWSYTGTFIQVNGDQNIYFLDPPFNSGWAEFHGALFQVNGNQRVYFLGTPSNSDLDDFNSVSYEVNGNQHIYFCYGALDSYIEEILREVEHIPFDNTSFVWR